LQTLICVGTTSEKITAQQQLTALQAVSTEIAAVPPNMNNDTSQHDVTCHIPSHLQRLRVRSNMCVPDFTTGLSTSISQLNHDQLKEGKYIIQIIHHCTSSLHFCMQQMTTSQSCNLHLYMKKEEESA
jgi:hypothetical protein